MKVCKNCHWYLMTTACLKDYDMKKGLIGLCQHFMVYCNTEGVQMNRIPTNQEIIDALTEKVEVLREVLEDAEHLIAKTAYSEMFTHKKIKTTLAATEKEQPHD